MTSLIMGVTDLQLAFVKYFAIFKAGIDRSMGWHLRYFNKASPCELLLKIATCNSSERSSGLCAVGSKPPSFFSCG